MKYTNTIINIHMIKYTYNIYYIQLIVYKQFIICSQFIYNYFEEKY